MLNQCQKFQKKKKNQLVIKYGIREDVLFNAAKLLEITAREITEDLNKCEVDCKCW